MGSASRDGFGMVLNRFIGCIVLVAASARDYSVLDRVEVC